MYSVLKYHILHAKIYILFVNYSSIKLGNNQNTCVYTKHYLHDQETEPVSLALAVGFFFFNIN